MAKILVCDDAMFMRQTIIKMLEGVGHEVIAQAGNGVECISMYKSSKPDIVLMDITMPDMNGIEATRKIMELDSEAKIIMVSAMGQMEMVVGAVEAGAKDFVVKPFEPEKLIACVNKYA